MRLKRTRLTLFVVMLMLSAQLSAAPATARDTSPPAKAATQDHGHHVGIPGSRCRRRCNTDYRRCLRRGKNRRACARQLRNCQRRCPQ